MRLEPQILFDVIPKFLRDGWQVVSSSTLLVVRIPVQWPPRMCMQ